MQMTRIKLSALWATVNFNILIADIIGFIHPGVLQKILNGDFGGISVTPELLLLFSVVNEIPILMVFFSLTLPVKATRWLSTGAALLTTLYVVGGGSATYSYYFFASMEILAMLAVVWYVWTELSETQNPTQRQV